MTSLVPTPEDSKAAPRPFQFGLRALFFATACFSALFAVMSFIGAVWSAILVWFLLLVLLHVAANAWGSHRWRRDGQDAFEAMEEVPPWRSGPPAEAPATRLRESTRLGWTMFVVTISGAVLGGALGAGSLACLGSAKVGYVAIVVGGISSAILGGFFGFLTSSFVEVAGQAWREAVSGRPAQQAFEAGKEAGP